MGSQNCSAACRLCASSLAVATRRHPWMPRSLHHQTNPHRPPPPASPCQDIDINDIAASSDAIVLAAGATKPRDLPIDGR